MHDYYQAVIFSLLAAGSLLVSWRYFGHLLSPFGVFFGIWFTALAMFCLRWVDYDPLGTAAETLITLSMISFGLGWLVVYILKGKSALSRQRPFEPAIVSGVRLRRLIFLFAFLGMIGLGEFLWDVQHTVGLSAYLESPHVIRQEMETGQISEGIKVFNWLNVLNVVLCVVYLRVEPNKKRRSVWAILLISSAATLLMEDRTRFFYAALWAVFVLAHLKAWKMKKVVVGGVMVAVLLLVQFLAVAAWLGKVARNSPDLMQAANISERLEVLLPPYVYFTGSFPALQKFALHASGDTQGEMTFHPLFKVLSVFDERLTPPDIIGEFYQIPFAFNTFTWLQQFFSDFGTWGAVFGPLVVGSVAALVYFESVMKGSLYTIYANGLISFCLALSVMVNHLTQGPAWYFLFVGSLICWYIKRRPVHSRAMAIGRARALPRGLAAAHPGFSRIGARRPV